MESVRIFLDPRILQSHIVTSQRLRLQVRSSRPCRASRIVVIELDHVMAVWVPTRTSERLLFIDHHYTPMNPVNTWPIHLYGVAVNPKVFRSFCHQRWNNTRALMSRRIVKPKTIQRVSSIIVCRFCDTMSQSACWNLSPFIIPIFAVGRIADPVLSIDPVRKFCVLRPKVDSRACVMNSYHLPPHEDNLFSTQSCTSFLWIRSFHILNRSQWTAEWYVDGWCDQENLTVSLDPYLWTQSIWVNKVGHQDSSESRTVQVVGD
jgi:hypothetical protein